MYEALRRHAETFLADVAADPASSGLPAFVRGEAERFLKCGILAHGFVRVYCPTCKDDQGGRHAAVTKVQRFGSSLNLNVHLHGLVAEGSGWPARTARGSCR